MGIKTKKIHIQNKSEIDEILARSRSDFRNTFEVIKPILQAVEQRGDAAIREYTEKFDGLTLNDFRVEPMQEPPKIDASLQQALQKAYENIEAFHKMQLPQDKEIQIDGNRLGIKHTPVESVTIYAPGGKALYPSSILMGAIPARVAGVKKINLLTPPAKSGKLPDGLLYTAHLTGIDTIYTIGGAQGIAAVAYGSETIEKSEFVVGPGNHYVAAAKTYLAGLGIIGIESPAGPSEILILADDTANPEWIACDMLSQAEHGEDSPAILVTDSEQLARQVEEQLEKALQERPKRQKMKQQAIYEKGNILIFPDMDQGIEFANLYAAEHLEIMTAHYRQDFDKIQHAGSVFLGPYSPVAMGDYISGTNHILPTAGGSRIYSSLGVDTFLKRVTYQEISQQSLNKLYPHVKVLSEFEGLDEEHGTSVYLRTNYDANL